MVSIPVGPDGSYLILFAVPAAAAVGAKRITIRQIANGTRSEGFC